MSNSINFKSHPNQRAITIHRDMPKDGAKDYLCVFNKNLFAAMKNISGEVALKLYIYLLTNKDNYEFWYSPAHFCSTCAASPDAARRALKQLIELGYVIEFECNKLSFYEEPQKKTAILLGEEEKRYVPTDEGDILMTYSEVYKELKDSYPADFISRFWNDCRKEDK